MKKLILLITVLTLLLTGCSSDDANSTGKEVNQIVSGDKTVTTNTNTENKVEPKPEASIKANITETVIYDENDIVVTAKSLKNEGLFGPELELFIENNSNENMTVQARDVSVNGIMIDTMFSGDVGAGKQSNESMTFLGSDISVAQITTFSEIEFVLHIFKTDEWSDSFDSERITIKTDQSDHIQKIDDAGIVAYDEDGIRIVAKKLESENSFWGADLYLFIENNSKKDLIIQVRNVSINGLMVDPIFSSEVLSQKKAYDSITFFESELTKNNITDIHEIELSFSFINADTWEDSKQTKPITVKFD